MDMPPERLAFVGQMLKRQVTIEEAIAIMAPLDRPLPAKKRKRGKSQTAPADLPPGDGPHAQSIRKLVAGMQPGDDLWLYDSDPEDWQQLRGVMGFAVVRAGQVVAFDMHLMN